MTSPETRSLYGTTYVPIKLKESPELRRPYEKARIAWNLWRDPTTAIIIANKYREKHLSEDSDLNKKQKTRHSELLNALESYSKDRSYRELVSFIGNVPVDTLTNFSQKWLSLEHEILMKAIEDWTVTMEEELSSAKSIKEESDDIRPKYTPASTEDLRNPTDLPSAPITIEKPEEPILEPIMLEIPKAKIWGKMWENEARRENARFLVTYSLTTEIALQFILNTILGGPYSSSSTIMSLTKEDLEKRLQENLKQRTDVINETLKQLVIEPLGMLFLERLNFTSTGYVKGELVYTLPLTPNEKITVSHKEWSKTTEEYVKEVEVTIEEEIEKEISENIELTESVETEKDVEHKVGASVSAKGKAFSWQIEAKTSYDFTTAQNSSREYSSKKNQEMTSKAASRSKKEHKISFKVAREVHVEDEQVREIVNESDSPVRWDFYRMMKKWKIDLYHIGYRMTYDIVVPEPQDYLLRKYVELRHIQEEIDSGFLFDLLMSSITEDECMDLAARYGVDLGKEELLPPSPELSITKTDFVEFQGKKERGMRIIDFEFPEGYEITGYDILYPIKAEDIGQVINDKVNYVYKRVSDNWRNLERLHIARTPKNKFSWIWSYQLEHDNTKPTIRVKLLAQMTVKALKSWKLKVLEKLREAAHAQWLVRLEGLQNQRDRLIAELMGQDSLKLRQMEREEIMKGVLRWILGPEFEFYPEGLRSQITIEDPIDPLDYYNPDTGRLRYGLQEQVLQYGEIIRFIHQAIEWENVSWILYPYFWTIPGPNLARWDFKQSLDHPDAYHRSFLRAGCARVIIPIREGFEEAWISFIENVDELPKDHPYIELATEMKEQAQTYFPYTPDPNREELVQFGHHQDTWYEYTPTGALHIEKGEAPLDY